MTNLSHFHDLGVGAGIANGLVELSLSGDPDIPDLSDLDHFFVDKLFILCEVIQIIFEIQPVIFDHLDFRRRLPSFGLFLHSYKLYPDEPLSI